MFSRSMHTSAAILCGVALGCSGDVRDTQRLPPPPPSVARMAQQLDTIPLRHAFARASELPRMRSLLVQWRGEVVGEEYFGGATHSSRANIKSASKSVLSALVGIAIDQGAIRDVHQTIGDLLPADTRGLDSIKRSITVEDLLSMRSGLESTSFANYGSWVTSRHWVRNALARPMVAEPGGPMIYSTGNSHLLSAILTRATGMSTYRFAERYLARPLGIPLRPWLADPQGILFGGNDMYLTPRAMLGVGTLYLNRGALNGQQVVSAAWVDSSFVPRTTSPWNGNRYGYGWWSRTARGVAVHYAWGYGGQFIFIVPTLELVVVMTSDADTQRERGHNRELHAMLADHIMSAVSTLE